MPHSSIHTHTLMMEAAMQGANCSSGAIWGSVSWSRTLRHAARGSRDLNPITRQPALPTEPQPHQQVILCISSWLWQWYNFVMHVILTVVCTVDLGICSCFEIGWSDFPDFFKSIMCSFRSMPSFLQPYVNFWPRLHVINILIYKNLACLKQCTTSLYKCQINLEVWTHGSSSYSTPSRPTFNHKRSMQSALRMLMHGNKPAGQWFFTANHGHNSAKDKENTYFWHRKQGVRGVRWKSQSTHCIHLFTLSSSSFRH